MNLDLVKYAVNNLWNRKRRSFLTVLSVFIGIMAIFALVSFGEGISSYVDDIAKEMGSDKIIVQPKGSFGNPAASPFKFSEDDVAFLEQVNGVQEVGASLMEEVLIQEDLDERGKIYFAMSLPEGRGGELIKEMTTVEVAQGRDLEDDDKAKVLIGNDYTVPNRVFDKALGVGDRMYINGHEVDIVGVFEPIGNPNDDRAVFFSEEGMLEVLDIQKDFSWIVLRIAPGEEPAELAEKIQDKFRRHKNEEEGQETFSVQTLEDLIATFETLINVINGVLFLIAIVSVIVAAVNIMNTMYTAVLERTNEIGIMKAIGAKNSAILFIFVFEAGVLGLVGSLIGMALGYGIAEMGGYIATVSGYAALQPAYPIRLVIGVLLFGFLVGAGAGLAPAIQGSRQKPVDALRYE